MSTALFKVRKEFCGDCSNALKRFIGGMDGVSEVRVENGMVAVEYDEKGTRGVDVPRVAKESIERLGYRVDES